MATGRQYIKSYNHDNEALNMRNEDYEELVIKSNLKITEKIHDMIEYGMPIIKLYPKRERILANKIMDTLYEMIKSASEIEFKAYKQNSCYNLLAQQRLLTHLLRISSNPELYVYKLKRNDIDIDDSHVVYDNEEGKYYKVVSPPLPQRKFRYWMSLNIEVGKMTQAYLNYVLKNDSRKNK